MLTSQINMRLILWKTRNHINPLIPKIILSNQAQIQCLHLINWLLKKLLQSLILLSSLGGISISMLSLRKLLKVKMERKKPSLNADKFSRTLVVPSNQVNSLLSLDLQDVVKLHCWTSYLVDSSQITWKSVDPYCWTAPKSQISMIIPIKLHTSCKMIFS